MLAAWPSLIITYMNAPTDFWCARPIKNSLNKGGDSTEAHASILADPTALEWGIEVKDIFCTYYKIQFKNKYLSSSCRNGDLPAAPG
jgi:hypothetical protein